MSNCITLLTDILTKKILVNLLMLHPQQQIGQQPRFGRTYLINRNYSVCW
ncbi:hypothetical protein [Vibrio sp. A8-1]